MNSRTTVVKNFKDKDLYPLRAVVQVKRVHPTQPWRVEVNFLDPVSEAHTSFWREFMLSKEYPPFGLPLIDFLTKNAATEFVTKRLRRYGFKPYNP